MTKDRMKKSELIRLLYDALAAANGAEVPGSRETREGKMTKLEEVARAIMSSMSDDKWELIGDHFQEVYMREARVAVETLKVPSESIRPIGIPNLDQIWNERLDAILKEKL